MFDLTRVNWSRLYYFYLVGQCRNITTAARYANIDQSGMSRHMMALEKELGVELLLRSRDGITFTEIGESVYNAVSKMVELSTDANREVDKIQNDMVGSLRVLTTQSLARKYTTYMPKFYEKFSNIRVCLNVSRDLNPIHILDNHDIAIFAKFSENPDFEYVPYQRSKQAIFASKEYLQRFGIPQKPEDLDCHRLISFSPNTTPSQGFVDFHLTLGKKNREMREAYFQAGAADSLIAACQQGMGIITYIDEKEVPLPDNFVKILEEYYTESLDFHFVFKKKQKESRKILEFVRFFKNI